MAASKDKKPDAYALMRQLVIRGEVLPNQRLVETDFAERFGTNRANIRKALAKLEQEGLVVCEPFRGARVRLVTEVEALEIFDVRGALEVLMAHHAARKAGKADIEKLKERFAEVRRAAAEGDPVAVGACSRRLREEIWRISGHVTGARLLTALNSQLVRYWYGSILMPGRAEEMTNQLEDVVKGIVSASPERAEKAMRAYHDGAIAALKKAVRIRMPASA